jgi:hypothetical protein
MTPLSAVRDLLNIFSAIFHIWKLSPSATRGRVNAVVTRDPLRTGFIWLRIGTSGGFLWTRRWTSVFHKLLGNSWVAEWLMAAQGLSSVGLVSPLYAFLAWCLWTRRTPPVFTSPRSESVQMRHRDLRADFSPPPTPYLLLHDQVI